MNQQPPQQPTLEQQRTSKTVPIFIIVVVILAISVGIYAYLTQTVCEKEVIVTNVNVSNTNAVADERCSWKPLIENNCGGLVMPGYYYNNETGKCQYYSDFGNVGNGCSSPPFSTVDKCRAACEWDVSQKCSQITDKFECKARDDCIAIDFCGCTTLSEWHQKCGVEEEAPCLCVMDGFILCDDLDCGAGGPPPYSVFCKWRPTKDYGTCEKSLGSYYDGTECVTVIGCDLQGDTIPFMSLNDCQRICDVDKAYLLNGPVSRICTGGGNCGFIDSTKDYSEYCPVYTCPDYSESKYVAVNNKAFDEFILKLRTENNFDASRCLPFPPSVCPIIEGAPIAECRDNLCVKVFK